MTFCSTKIRIISQARSNESAYGDPACKERCWHGHEQVLRRWRIESLRSRSPVASRIEKFEYLCRGFSGGSNGSQTNLWSGLPILRSVYSTSAIVVYVGAFGCNRSPPMAAPEPSVRMASAGTVVPKWNLCGSLFGCCVTRTIPVRPNPHSYGI